MPIRPITKGAAIKENLLEEEEFEQDEFEDEDDDEEVMEDDEEEEEEEDEGEDEYEDDDDDYEYEDRSRLIPYTVMAIALVAFVSLGYYAYNSGTQTISNDELMLIQAEQTPVKEKPLDPGGLQFPYQDKSVFETITADSSAIQDTAVVSNIEEPMVIEPTTSSIVSEDVAPPTEMVESTTPKAPVAQQPVEEVASAPAPMVKEALPVKVAETTPEPVAEESVPAPKADTPVSSAVMTGSDTVQLGAYRSSDDAQAAWDKIRSNHNVLSGLTPTIVRADLGEPGVFYRLRVAGVDGQNLCGALKTAGQPCIKAN